MHCFENSAVSVFPSVFVICVFCVICGSLCCSVGNEASSREHPDPVFGSPHLCQISQHFPHCRCELEPVPREAARHAHLRMPGVNVDHEMMIGGHRVHADLPLRECADTRNVFVELRSHRGNVGFGHVPIHAVG